MHVRPEENTSAHFVLFVLIGSVSVAFETSIRGSHCNEFVQSFFTPSSYDLDPDTSGADALVVNNDLRLSFPFDQTYAAMFRSVFMQKNDDDDTTTAGNEHDVDDDDALHAATEEVVVVVEEEEEDIL